MAVVHLGHEVALRELLRTDAAALADAYRTNRARLAPWEPLRQESFFTDSGQQSEVDALLEDRGAGIAAPFVLVHGGRIVGRVNLSGIVRGAFQSANLGYWIDAGYGDRGLMTAAVDAVAEIAVRDLRLHRLQAGTLLRNSASQAVLRRCGFAEIGVAERYLRIAGEWQDHLLFQRILAD